MIILPPTIPPRTRQQLSAYVIETIEAAGVPVPASSRLRRIYDLHHSGREVIAADDPNYEIAVEGIRDMQLLGFAFDQLGQAELSAECTDRLEKLVGDTVLPQDGGENSPGRDAGFELYVGAICKAAKLQPIWEEPDICCELDGTKYGFAAKRLKGLGNLEKRVKKAVRQINGSGLPGVVILDLAMAFNPANRRLRQMDEAVMWEEYQINFRVTWGEYNAKVQKIIGRGDVLGIIVHDYHIRACSDGPELAGMTFRIPAESRTPEERRRFEKLSTCYVHGVPNQTDEGLA